MIRYFTIVIYLYLIILKLNAQSVIETDSIKFWYPNLRITISDFKGDTTSRESIELKEKYNVLSSSSVVITRRLDIPRRKRDRGKLLERVYFVPRWIKYGSTTFTRDSMELEKEKLYLDLAELICRMARSEIDSLQRTSKTYGILYFAYVPIANSYCEKFVEIHKEYTIAVFVEKDEQAYQSWRDAIDLQLEKYSKYATTSLDCQRMLTTQPSDKNYILSPYIFGDKI